MSPAAATLVPLSSLFALSTSVCVLLLKFDLFDLYLFPSSLLRILSFLLLILNVLLLAYCLVSSATFLGFSMVVFLPFHPFFCFTTTAGFFMPTQLFVLISIFSMKNDFILFFSAIPFFSSLLCQSRTQLSEKSILPFI